MILEMQKKRKMYSPLGDLGVWLERWNLHGEIYKAWQATMLRVKGAVQTIGAQVEKREGSLGVKDARKSLRVTQINAVLLNSPFRISDSTLCFLLSLTKSLLSSYPEPSLVLNLFYKLLFLANDMISSVSQHDLMGPSVYRQWEHGRTGDNEGSRRYNFYR